MPIKSSWLFISPNVLDLRASQCRNPNLFLKTRQGFCFAFTMQWPSQSRLGQISIPFCVWHGHVVGLSPTSAERG